MDSTFLQPDFFPYCCCDYCPFVTPPPFCPALSHGGAIRTTKQHSRCNQSTRLFFPALFILLSPHTSPKLLFAESISVRGTSILQCESLKQVLLDCFFCLLLEQKQGFAFFFCLQQELSFSFTFPPKCQFLWKTLRTAGCITWKSQQWWFDWHQLTALNWIHCLFKTRATLLLSI